MSLSDVVKPDPSFFEMFQPTIDAAIAAAQLGELSEAQVQAIVDAAVGTAEADDLSEADVQALIDASISAMDPAQSILFKFIKRAASNSITLSSNIVAEIAAALNGPGAGGFDISLPAAVDDVLEWTFNGLVGAAAFNLGIDIYTVNGAEAKVNPFGAGLSDGMATTAGALTWFCVDIVNMNNRLGGSALHKVVAGDIVGGQVKCRPYYVVGAGSPQNRTLFCTANYQLEMSLKNLGPATA